MSYAYPIIAVCPNCRTKHEIKLYSFLNTSMNPELFEQLLEGCLNTVVCPHCSKEYVYVGSMIVHLRSEHTNRMVHFSLQEFIDEATLDSFITQIDFSCHGVMPITHEYYREWVPFVDRLIALHTGKLPDEE